MKPITAVMVGAGQRGMYAYGTYALAHPDELKFVAVAEPIRERREKFAQLHGIPAEMQFESWETLMERGKIADVMFNMTMDRTHFESTMHALKLGYDVLLEKPIAHTPELSVALVLMAEKMGRLLQVCHVLRYTSFFRKLNELLAQGVAGELITVEHKENLVWWHMAHSFVRGNWRRADLSTPMIVAKCCHDFDILYWNIGRKAVRVHSTGTLKHFRSENAPKGAPKHCLDPCPARETCPYDVHKIYLNMENNGWPINAITSDLSYEGRLKALRETGYGRCVYHCDNDVVDHQVVNIEFEDGITVAMTMNGHGFEESRTMRYDGTRATIRGKFDYRDGWIEILPHSWSGKAEEIHIPPSESGHGGGDFGIVRGFLRSVMGIEPPLTTAREAIESHLIAFAAERSRLTGQAVEMENYRAEIWKRAEEIVEEWTGKRRPSAEFTGSGHRH